ncbi:LysR substrate-binding domain-containing protein [Sphingomonas sp.]|uniref:LysR family transcriptional regulator n=1 Tax=Sphingomonas sp. TaxID=28214 RepID=UPI003B3BD82D
MLFDGRIIAGITVFVAVARAGNYARAAEQLALSRSGVAKAIGRLEERTGMRLFDRNARAIKLTDQGRTFLDEATPMLEALGRIATPATPANIRGRLRISTDGALGPYLLIPILPEFLAENPQVKIDLLVRDRVDNLLLEGVDAAIRFGEPKSRDLDKRPLLRSRVVTCASKAYVEQHGRPTSPRDVLDNHRCIRMFDEVTGKPHIWNFVDAQGEQQPIAPDCGLTLNDAASLIAAALSDMGIVRLLDCVAAEYLRDGRLVEVLPEWNNLYWPSFIYTPIDSHKSVAIDAFTRFVRSRLEQGGTMPDAARGPSR